MATSTAPVESDPSKEVSGTSRRFIKKDSSVRFHESTEEKVDDDSASYTFGSGGSDPNNTRSSDPLEPPGSPRSARTLLSFPSNVSGSTTYGSQHHLPRLPVPTLEATMNKFSNVVMKALLTEEEFKEMNKAVEEFLKGDGPVLQKALLDYEKEKVLSGEIGSYVEEFWNESYLSPDASVVMNLNPYFVLEEGPDPKIAKDQLRRAASLCFASIKVASVLKTESLEPDLFKGKPLCMDQFRVLFGSSRQPMSDGSDNVHVYSDSTHGKWTAGGPNVKVPNL